MAVRKVKNEHSVALESQPNHSRAPAVTRATGSQHVSPGQAAQVALRRLNGGNPLPLPTRARMERSFGRSFADVRTHTDVPAASVASEHSAQALTIGNRIAFGTGQFRPGTPSGDHLIAHELAHVVQQSASGGAVAQPRSVHSQPGEAAELQAEAVASRVVRGQPAGLSPIGLAVTTRQRIMRQALRRTSSLPVSLTLKLSPQGQITVEVTNVPFLEQATGTGRFVETLVTALILLQSSVGGMDTTGGTIRLSYANGAITGQGQIELSAAEGKLSGTVDAAFDGQAWTVNGTAQVRDLIPNLEPFEVAVSYADEQFVVEAQNIEYTQELGAITMNGRVDELVWDQESGGFSGNFNLNVDLAMFGAATATAAIVNNELTEATVDYNQPELRYPAEGESPVLTGTVQGTLIYDQTDLSGTIDGTANLALAEMGAEASNLALAVNATLNADGTYAGSIATTETLSIGEHFRMNGLSLTLNPDGSLAGDFALEVVDVSFLSSASVTGSVDEKGLQLSSEIAVGTGSVGGVDVTGGTIGITYANDAITGQGSIGISAIDGKLAGTVEASYDGQRWTFAGTAQVSELIPNFEPFEVSVSYAEDQVVIEAKDVQYSQEVGAISFTGTIDNLVWDQATSSFSGRVALDVDLGLFGAATAAATIENNAVSQWTVEYTTPELRYPAEGDSPVFTGQITGTLGYENDQLSGSFTGTANIAMPELAGQDVSNLGLQVNAALEPDGTYSGTIATTEILQIGDYFAIPGLSATLQPDGSLSGEFAVELMNLPYLESASIACAIDETGVTVQSAAASVAFGDESSRTRGTMGLKYREGEGFALDGSVEIELSEGMVATGEVHYTTATNEVTATLGMDEVPLLEMGGEERTLFEFDKDLIIFTLYQIVGLYLDVGFDLSFSYDVNLSMRPEVTLTGLSLEDFGFDEASAEVGFLGALAARLTATPNLGVGAFAGHPKILRGGGGLAVPVVANAELDPQGTFGIRFNPEGGVDGDATLGLVLTFEINGSVVPYAEFAVLDGAFEKDWQGDSLADFEILPERELFNYTIDFNALGEDRPEPQLPTSLQEPTANNASTVWTQAAGTATRTPVQANREAATSRPGDQEKAEDDVGGLRMGSLVSALLGGGSLGTIRDILDSVGAVWEEIKDHLDAVHSFFKNWFTTIGANVQETMRRMREEGFLGLVKSLLREHLDENVYDRLEPLLEAVSDIETLLLELLKRSLDALDYWSMLAEFLSA